MRQLLVVFLAAVPNWACSCFSNATPCSALGGSSVMFVAEVTRDSGDGWGTGAAQVTIVEPLQNVPEGLKEATIDTASGTSCYRRLRSGVRYVIITDGPRYSVGGCNPSFELTGNEHILDAIRSRLKGDRPLLVGSVFKAIGPYSRVRGVSGAGVELKRGNVRYTATTDDMGRYLISGLEPGRYRFRVWKDGYVPDDEYNNRWSGRIALNQKTNRVEPVKEAPGEVEMRANSCQIRDLAMWAAGKVGGVVRGLDGIPLAGVAVQAFELGGKGERSSSPLQTAVTDSEGKYVVQPLPPGQYVIGVNARLYNDDNPYPPTVYADGRPVYLGESASVVGIDLVVPAPRTSARLRIRAVTPDGNPCKRATVRLDTPAGVERWFSLEATDHRGEVLAPVYIGQSYTVRVFHHSAGRHWEGSAAVQVTDLEPEVSVVMLEER